MTNGQSKSEIALKNKIYSGSQTPFPEKEFLSAEAIFIMEKKAQKVRSYSNNPVDQTNSIHPNKRICLFYSYNDKEIMISSLIRNYSKHCHKVNNSKVMFKDEKHNKPFVNIINVESYKKFNAANTFILSSNKKPTIGACCIIC